MSGSDTRRVELPAGLVTRVESRLDHTDFDSVSAYTTFVMEQVLRSVEGRSDEAPAVDEDQMRDRLESLGYL